MDRIPVLSRRRLRAALVVCLLAAGLGLWLRYETARHDITGLASSCTVSVAFDCDVVQASAYARVFGVSLSIWAAVGHLLLATWLLAAARGRPGLLVLAGLASVFSALFSIFLLGVSLLELGVSCLYCNGIQLGAVILAVLVAPPAWRAWRGGALADARPLAGGALAAALLLLLGVSGNAWADRRVELARLYSMPRGAELEVDVSDAILLGDPATPNSLVVYFDYTCPHCRGAHELIEELLKKYPGRLHAMFKHYPLNTECNPGPKGTLAGHEAACIAARASCAAQLLGKGTPWARLTLETRGAIYRATLDRNAERAGIEAGEWKAAQEDPRAAAILERDVAEGVRLDITALPAVFLNGNLIDWSRLRRIIER